MEIYAIWSQFPYYSGQNLRKAEILLLLLRIIREAFQGIYKLSCNPRPGSWQFSEMSWIGNLLLDLPLMSCPKLTNVLTILATLDISVEGKAKLS